MNANLRQFQAFVTVARLGSFTRAAKHLHLSQPALTVQIRQLEEAMEVRLFDRSTRVVMLTPIGRELAPTLGRVLQEIDAVMTNTKELASHVKGFRTIRHQRFIRQIGVIQYSRRSLSPSAEIFIKMLSSVCKSRKY